MSPDPDATAAFYTGLFGWHASAWTPSRPVDNPPPYTLFQLGPDDRDVAGLLPAPRPDLPAQWIPYFVVEDIQAALDRATALGATALMPIKDLGPAGHIALIRDPQGAVLGLHELAKRTSSDILPPAC